MHRASGEVEVIDSQPEDLSLPQPAAGAQVHHRTVPLSEAIADCRNLVGPPGDDATLQGPGRLDRGSRTPVLGDALVVDSRTEDGPQVGEDNGAGRGSQLADHCGVPLSDVPRLERGQLPRAEERQQVLAHPELCALPRRLVRGARPPPALGILGEGDPAGGRVDVRAAELVRLGGDEERVSFTLGPVRGGLATFVT